MEKRTTFVSKLSYRGQSWKLFDEASSDARFDSLDGIVYDDRGSRSVRWSATKSRKHLSTNYCQSAFLNRIGVYPRKPFTCVTVCEDGELICEFLVIGSDGHCYDRAELSANCGLTAWNRAVDFVPTPEEIARECRKIRASKPVSDYAEQWTGKDGASVREISLSEVANACFD